MKSILIEDQDNEALNPIAIIYGGKTTLHVAAISGASEIIVLLIKGGADIESKDVASRTALHYAALCGNSDALLTLINLGANVNAIDINGDVPLHLSIKGVDCSEYTSSDINDYSPSHS